MSVQLQSAPAVGIIDENGVLTLSFSPFPGPDGLFDQYASWNIRTKHNADSPTTFVKDGQAFNPGETTTSRVFSTNLASGDYTLTMQAVANGSGSPTATDSNWWQTSGVGDGTTGTRLFPATVGPSTVTFDNTTLLLGQQLNISLNPAYTQADQWRVVWPDQSTSGWLPLSASIVTKSFSTPGAQVVVVQTRFDYTGGQYNPPATLIRQLSVQIFVMDQQAPTTSSTSGNLSTTLGFGGTEGFEIIDTSAQTVTPEPWEVIARAVVRDTITNELKLLVAASRFPNASSLFGTMALDVFPIPGRPHAKELLEPIYELITGPNTSAVPVKIQTSAIPDLIVGKSINDALGGTLQMTVKDSTGIPNFIWTAVGLPTGVFLSSNGVISGTPLELGQFNVTFAVQDSGTPFSIDEITLPVLVKTDMLVKMANQPATVTDLGTATVGTPYSQLMAVGNVVTSSPLPGGLPPYKWSTPAGSLPVGISIDPNTGLLSGTPCTYNSTTDFFANTGKIFSVVIQVTDAIGAKASQTFTLKLAAAPLTIGNPDQTVVYATQDFKLAVPIYGGKSPYTLTTHNDDGASSPSATYTLVDGQVEVVLNIPATSTGVHSITLGVTDAASTLVSRTLFYTVGLATQQTGLVKAFVDHYWFNGDSAAATPIPVVPNTAGNFSGLVLVDNSQIFTNGITVAVNSLLQEATFTGPATPFRNSEGRIPLTLDHAESQVGIISRVYSLLAHNKTSPGTSVGDIQTFAHPYIQGSTFGFNPRKPFFNSPATIPVSVSGASLTVRMKAGNALPQGLSLDANTGLVYGQILSIPTDTSTFEYVDGTGLVTGTVTTTWTQDRNDFQTINTFVDASLNTPYDSDNSPLGIMAPPAGITLTGVSVFYGTLPAGMSVAINLAGNAVVKGTPVEAGYFDVWFLVTSSSGQRTVVYQRIAVDDPWPLLIVNTTLPDVGAGAYSAQLYGFGGVPDSSGLYAWSSPQFPGGSGTGAFTGLSLNASTGAITGTLTSPPGGSGRTSLGNIQVVLQDFRTVLNALSPSSPVSLPAIANQTINLTYTGQVECTVAAPNGLATAVAFGLSAVAAAVSGSAAYTFTSSQASAAANAYVGRAFIVTGFVAAAGVNNGTFLCTASSSTTLTLANGGAVIETHAGNAGLEYGYKLVPAGGTPPYTWSITAGALPSGITLTPSTGVLSGAWDGSVYTNPTSITFRVTDNTAVTKDTVFQFRTGLETLVLTNSHHDGGPAQPITAAKVNVGSPYLEQLLVKIASPFTQGAAVQWQVAPTTAHTNSLPTGLVLLTDSNQQATLFANPDNGETASLGGTYSGSPFSGRLVRCVAVDASGNTGSIILNFTTGTNMVITDTNPLPNATVGVSYSYTMHVSGGVGPYTWTWDQAHPFHGLDISSAGVITGTALTTFTQNILFTVTDSLGNQATASLSLTAQPLGLTINTNGPIVVTSGRLMTPLQFVAGGVPGTDNLIWSISPLSANQLPSGLSFSAGGVLSGITTVTGYDQFVTFRVNDITQGSVVDKTIEVKVIAGLNLATGIDTADSLSTNILGYIDAGAVTSINPRPNQSFLIIATGVVSTAPSQILITTSNPGVTATVQSINSGTATIILSGAAFAVGTPGTYPLSVTLTDSGVAVTKSFNWVVYNDGVLRITGANAFPQQLA
jgi:hypothetical protein